MTSIRSRPTYTSFGPLRLETDVGLLPPRVWTTAQARWARELLEAAPAGPVLELCAGLGHIGLLAVRGTERRLVSVDREPTAARLIRRNAVAAGLDAQVEIRCGPLDAVLEEHERFAMVIADPPWVPTSETTNFPDDPVRTIDGGSDGLSVARECVHVIARQLLPGGRAVLQLGHHRQATALRFPSPLRVGEIRDFPRGVLVQLTRPTRAEA